MLVLGMEVEGSPIRFRDPSSWQHRKCQKGKPSNLSQQTNFVVLLYIGCYFNLGFAFVLKLSCYRPRTTTKDGEATLIEFQATQKSKSNRPIAHLWSKMAFFYWAWRKVKVLPRS